MDALGEQAAHDMAVFYVETEYPDPFNETDPSYEPYKELEKACEELYPDSVADCTYDMCVLFYIVRCHQ